MEMAATTASVRSILEYVVGLNPELIARTLGKTRVEIDGQAYSNGEEQVPLRVGSVVELRSITKINVISAHLRTLMFYDGLAS